MGEAKPGRRNDSLIDSMMHLFSEYPSQARMSESENERCGSANDEKHLQTVANSIL
jgi:hypothetical protein